MRTRIRPVVLLVCGALLGCPAPAEPNKPETGGGDESDGESDGGTLGHGETGGAPTGATGASSSEPAGASGSSGAVVETTGAASTGASETGCSFICDDTEGPTCFSEWVEGEGLKTRCSKCDVFAQDCADGQKCVAWAEGGGTSWNDTKCVAVTGDGQHGDPCTTEGGGTTGVDDCALGFMCWDVVDDKGTCVALCTGSADAPKCIDDLVCVIANDGVLNLCLTPCDPLLQDCPGDDLCIPNGEEFVCVLDASGEEGQVHDVCEFVNACAKGLTCQDAATASSECDPAAAGCCEPFCEFPDGACPAADQKCVQWFDPMTLPMDDPRLDIGVCAIPQ